MTFRILIVWAIWLCTAPISAQADPVKPELQIQRQLEAQGYEIEELSWTFWGRLRIEAKRGNLERELVVNPRTGEILRDLLERDDDDDGDLIIGGSERGGLDDDDD